MLYKHRRAEAIVFCKQNPINDQLWAAGRMTVAGFIVQLSRINLNLNALNMNNLTLNLLYFV